MTRNVRLVFWAAGVLAIALAVVNGPLWAGYAIAGGALVFIAGLMGMRIVRTIGDWRLEHAPRFWTHRVKASANAHAERRAA